MDEIWSRDDTHDERYNRPLMKLCRFTAASSGDVHIGLVTGGHTLVDLMHAGVHHMTSLIERPDLADELARLARAGLPEHPLDRVRLLTPVESQEVWAAGVTYLRSKEARMEESEFSASARTTGSTMRCARRSSSSRFRTRSSHRAMPWASGGTRGGTCRSRSSRSVISSSARIVGFTIGNDMSSRDIEGENLLYLPQAKIYARSCAVGPWIVVGADEADVRQWSIQLEIERRGEVVFAGETSAGQIKRTFAELVEYCSDRSSFHTASCC